MDRLATATGRNYRIFEYHGDPKAERVIVAMGQRGRDDHRDRGLDGGQGREGWGRRRAPFSFRSP